jgi:hypothetical protein
MGEDNITLSSLAVNVRKYNVDSELVLDLPRTVLGFAPGS